MKTAPAPAISRTRTFSLIWVVPIVAVAIGVWMGVNELRERGPEIVIDFADGTGVEAGKTMLQYKGISAGVVRSVELKPGLEGVSVRVRLKTSAEALAGKGAKFWIVHPEIGFSGIHGLETLVAGVHLGVMPGNGPLTKRFRGLDKSPGPDVMEGGRVFILQSDRLGSLTTGAPVFYREFKVGSVVSSRLSDDSGAVLVRIHVEAPYVDLVRTNTRFWNTGGFSFKVNLFGAQLKDTSLESLITGGVAFATPDTGPLAPVAAAEDVFKVESAADKEWLKWAPRIPITSPDSMVEGVDKRGLLPALMK